MISKRLSDGAVTVTAESDGRLHLAVRNTSNEAVFLAKTCEITVEDNRSFAAILTWSVGGRFGAAINGTLLASPETSEARSDPYIIGHRQVREKQNYNEQSAAAQEQRRARHLAWKARPDRVRADEEYIVGELASELRQVSDLVELLRQGREHHVIGLANSLRKLIAVGRPLPHVQLVAAMRDAPLTIYTERARKVLEGAVEDLSLSIWSRPTDDDDNPVDLDVWLDLPGGRVAGKELTHREILRVAGDTMGAHFDADIHHALLMLKSSETGASGERRSLLLDYLLRVGCAASELAGDTLGVR
jgi:hypothetical protein